MNQEPHPQGEQVLVTLEEAGQLLGIKRRTVQDWIKDGKLPVWTVSPHHRYVIWSAISSEVAAIAADHAARFGGGS